MDRYNRRLSGAVPKVAPPDPVTGEIKFDEVSACLHLPEGHAARESYRLAAGLAVRQPSKRASACLDFSGQNSGCLGLLHQNVEARLRRLPWQALFLLSAFLAPWRPAKTAADTTFAATLEGLKAVWLTARAPAPPRAPPIGRDSLRTKSPPAAPQGCRRAARSAAAPRKPRSSTEPRPPVPAARARAARAARAAPRRHRFGSPGSPGSPGPPRRDPDPPPGRSRSRGTSPRRRSQELTRSHYAVKHQWLVVSEPPFHHTPAGEVQGRQRFHLVW